MLRLLDYMRVKYAMKNQPFVVLPHTAEMCRLIELCIAGGLPNGKKNLMINMPPRFGKTDTYEGAFEYIQGLIPDSNNILTSYAFNRATESAVKINRVFQEPWYRKMFPACVINNNVTNQKDEFYTTAGGGFKSAGAGGGITGFGAGVKRPGFGGMIGIDDPIKPIDARSETYRQKCVDWYNGTLKNRRNKSDRTPIILIMQRTHPDDLCGWLQKNEPEDWYCYKIVGHDRDNDIATWEETASLEYLKKLEIVDEFTYWSQYQQEPRHPGGSVIKDEWWNFYADIDEVRHRCTSFMMFGDTAMKNNPNNDYSVFQLWGFEGNTRAYLLDQVRGRWTFPDLVMTARAFWKKHYDDMHGLQTKAFWIEDKVSGTSLIQTLREEKIPVMEWVAKDFEIEHDDKVSRAQASAWPIYEGKVWLPDPEQFVWMRAYMDEMNAFSADMSHSFDDQVDATTMAVLTFKNM